MAAIVVTSLAPRRRPPPAARPHLRDLAARRRGDGRARRPADPAPRRSAARSPDGPTVAIVAAAGAALLAQWAAHTAVALDGGMTQLDTLYYHGPYSARFLQDGTIGDLAGLGTSGSRLYPLEHRAAAHPRRHALRDRPPVAARQPRAPRRPGHGGLGHRPAPRAAAPSLARRPRWSPRSRPSWPPRPARPPATWRPPPSWCRRSPCSSPATCARPRPPWPAWRRGSPSGPSSRSRRRWWRSRSV